MTFSLKREWLPLAAIALVGAATLWMYPGLPDPMPIHWNAAGQPDGYGPRLWGAFLLPGATLLLYGLLFLLPRIDPRRANIERFESTYRAFRTATTLFLLYFQIVVLYAVARGGAVLNTTLFVGGLGAFFIFIGNVMPRLRSNWFVGVRTPWTLDDDRVWAVTHRFAGRLTVAGGALLLAVAILAPGLLLPAILVMGVGLGFGSIAYSYFAHRSLRGGARADQGAE